MLYFYWNANIGKGVKRVKNEQGECTVGIKEK